MQVSSPRSTLGSGQAHSGSNTYLNLHDILTQPKDFTLPTLGPKLAAIKQEIVSGQGFKLIRWMAGCSLPAGLPDLHRLHTACRGGPVSAKVQSHMIGLKGSPREQRHISQHSLIDVQAVRICLPRWTPASVAI